jgi:multidrug transporter EmrE-like cation transporter
MFCELRRPGVEAGEKFAIINELIPAATVDQSLRLRALLMVFACTILGAAAQILMKYGLQAKLPVGAVAVLFAVATNVPIMTGFVLYGISTAILVLALRNQELSILYPVISLTYVWVAILSLIVFGESMNAYKIAGLTIIVLGVALLGKTGKK